MQINDQGGFRLAQNHLIYATGFYREAVYQVNRVSQAVYEHRISRARDPQFELVDALLLSSMIRSFPQLSLLPTFRLQRMSAYEAIRTTQQDQDWLEGHFMRLVPPMTFSLFSLDGTFFC